MDGARGLFAEGVPSVPVFVEFWIMGVLKDWKGHFLKRFGIPSVFGTVSLPERIMQCVLRSAFRLKRGVAERARKCKCARKETGRWKRWNAQPEALPGKSGPRGLRRPGVPSWCMTCVRVTPAPTVFMRLRPIFPIGCWQRSICVREKQFAATAILCETIGESLRAAWANIPLSFSL